MLEGGWVQFAVFCTTHDCRFHPDSLSETDPDKEKRLAGRVHFLSGLFGQVIEQGHAAVFMRPCSSLPRTFR